jgi:ubiquinone/menaquinone biosynthesis C-methylase UbiE
MSRVGDAKSQVRDFWDEQSCGEVYADASEGTLEYYESHRSARYDLEPYIFDFARFHEGTGKDVLEIGVGMGADHVEWAQSTPRTLTGIDLTPRAVEHSQKRLAIYGLQSNVKVDDAENLSFEDDSFDLIYSWGVLHHTPDTQRAIREAHRVLRPAGVMRFMIYHTYSLTGYMLWLRYAALTGRPRRTLGDIYAEHLESPGTKAYTVDEARNMCKDFSEVDVRVQLSFGDLLEGAVGQRHGGPLLTIAKKVWPRATLRMTFKNHGLMLLIETRN